MPFVFSVGQILPIGTVVVIFNYFVSKLNTDTMALIKHLKVTHVQLFILSRSA